MVKYDNLADTDARTRFLIQFQQDKGLKWVLEFKASVIHTDIASVSWNSDYRTPGEILSINGRTFESFQTEELAMADVEFLVRQNRESFNWTDAEHPPRLSEERPCYSKFWYVKCGGKSVSWKTQEIKQLTGEAALKNVKQIEDGMNFMEGLGYNSGSSATIENEKYGTMKTECDALKWTYLIVVTKKTKT